MIFKYFKNTKGEVYAYDISDPTQIPYMQKTIDDSWVDVTDSWPPKDVPPIENNINVT
jgi:hypothetical protein